MFGITDYAKPIVDFANFEASSFADAFVFGGAILLIGMATIFTVLCLLWGCLMLFKFFFHDLPEKKANAVAVAVPVTPVQEETTQGASDEEIVAVIAAAIAMAESESFGTKFNVVSFKRK